MNESHHYSRLSIALHWLTVALLVAVYACIELRVLFDKGSAPRDMLKTWHFMLGLTVFLVAGVRVAARLARRAPPITPAPPASQHAAATIVHVLLYAFLIGMPLAGWAILSASGKPVPFFGLELPALTGPDKPFASQAKDIHETVGEIGYWLIGAHALAGLFHHYLRRDDTLRRMLPATRGGR